MKKYLSYLFTIFLLAACSSQTLVDNIPNRMVEDKFIETSLKSDHKFDSNMLLKKHAVMMVIDVTKHASKILLTSLHDQLLTEFKKQNLIPVILPDSHFRKTIKDNPSMKLPSNLYLEAVSEVGISNRDISRPLGKLLKTKSFFILQLDQWPCPDCVNKNLIRVKVRYIDSFTGEIIWSGIGHRTIYDHEMEQKEEILKFLLHTLAVDFKERYQEKWHKVRARNLAK